MNSNILVSTPRKIAKFIPTILGDERFFSKTGALVPFDLNDAYGLLQLHEKRAIRKTSKRRIHQFFATFSLIWLKEEDNKKKTELEEKQLYFKKIIALHLPQKKQDRLKKQMFGLFEQVIDSNILTIEIRIAEEQDGRQRLALLSEAVRLLDEHEKRAHASVKKNNNCIKRLEKKDPADKQKDAVFVIQKHITLVEEYHKTNQVKFWKYLSEALLIMLEEKKEACRWLEPPQMH